MNHTFSLVCSWLMACLIPLMAQDPATEKNTVNASSNDSTRVTVLGYHDFSETQPETAMRMHTSKFKAQLQRIKDAHIPVISLADFIAWKNGTKHLPEHCILITIDDGWKSVYTDAYPILKEFNAPFTLYLYKQYVDGGGKALTTHMINEMRQHGAEIGCHSWSHPYPGAVKSQMKKGSETFDAFLRQEMGDSKQFLESKFSIPVTTYAYPGGFHTEEMIKLADEFKYSHLFTVIPGRVRRTSENHTLPRYMILGNYDKIFDMALETKNSHINSSSSPIPQVSPTKPAPKLPVTPTNESSCNENLPTISIQLASVTNLDPNSLSMRVSGFGEVPAEFDPQSKTFSWKASRKLYTSTTQVLVSWKLIGEKQVQEPIEWIFHPSQNAVTSN